MRLFRMPLVPRIRYSPATKYVAGGVIVTAVILAAVSVASTVAWLVWLALWLMTLAIAGG